MNSSNYFYYLSEFSKGIFFFINIFFLMNIEVSLSFFPIFNTATPSLVSVVIYLCIKKFNVEPSNLNLFFLGVLNDIFFGGNLGSSSIFFLLFKYFTEIVSININNKKYEEDWLYFTVIFVVVFTIIFSINIFVNFRVPDLSPILYHVGITLIIFPIINISLDLIYFITKLLKN
jgi:cell shape-determining protein MreD